MGRSSRPLDNGGRGGGRWRFQKQLFQPFRPQFGLKIRGRPSPGSATGISGTTLLDKKNEKTLLLASLAVVKPYS